VDSTLDAFLDSPLRICAEILLPVDQALLLRPGLDLGGVRRVYSHPMPGAVPSLAGIPSPQADRIEAPSPSEAARLAREDAEGAAVASELAAELFGLRVAETKIQDLAANATRFLVLGPKSAEPTGRDRTTLLAMAQDGSGALLRLLEPLARRGLNLSRIQSRPPGGSSGVRLLSRRGRPLRGSAHGRSPDGTPGACASLKLLGSYPQAMTEVPR